MSSLSRDNADRSRGRWAWVVGLVLLGLLTVPTALPAQAKLAGIDGESLDEDDLRDRDTIVVVWASWSPRGRDIVERVNGLKEAWEGKARVVTVNFQEDEETVRTFLASQKLTVPVFLDTDGAFSKKHAVTWLPGLLVFRSGEVAHKGRFAADADRTLERLFP